MQHQVQISFTKQIGKAFLEAGESYCIATTKAAKKTVNVTLCYYEGTVQRELFNVSDERVRWTLHSVMIPGSNRNQLVKVSFGPT